MSLEHYSQPQVLLDGYCLLTFLMLVLEKAADSFKVWKVGTVAPSGYFSYLFKWALEKGRMPTCCSESATKTANKQNVDWNKNKHDRLGCY